MNKYYKKICKELAKAMNRENGEYLVVTQVGEDEPMVFVAEFKLSTQLSVCEFLLGNLVTHEELCDEDFITVYDAISSVLESEYDKRFRKESKA